MDEPLDGSAAEPSQPQAAHRPVQPPRVFDALIDTYDIDLSRDSTTKAYAPHDLRPFGSVEGFRFRHGVQDAGAFAWDRISYGSTVDVQPFGPLTQCYCLVQPDAGHVTVTIRGRDVVVGPGQSAMIDAAEEFTMRWHAGAVSTNLRVPVESLHSMLPDVNLGAQPVFPLQLLSAGWPARLWQLANRRLRTLSATLPQHSLTAQDAKEFLLTSLLATHAPVAVEANRRQGWGPVTVRRAERYISDHLDQPMRVPEIAAAAGCSVRTLQAAFRSTHNLTVVAYVRRRRLEHARMQLVHGEPGLLTVTEVAYRWGFSNPGRFAAAYREMFGRSPSDDLAC